MEVPVILKSLHIWLPVLSFSSTPYIALESAIPVQLNVGVSDTVPDGEMFLTNCSWKQDTVEEAVRVPVASVMVKV